MDTILDFGLEASSWLQVTYPQLEGFFQFISTLGTTEFYLLLFPLLYWSIDKRLGIRVSYIFLVSTAINILSKQMLRGPRPFWLEPNLQLSEADGYGVPSGHMQLTATIYLFFVTWVKQRWMTILAVLMIISMGFSRVYLGVHFVHDVVVGFLLASLVLLGYFIWQRRFATEFDKRILGQRLLVAFLVPIIYGVLYATVRLIIGEPNSTLTWFEHMSPADLSSVEDATTIFGALIGFSAGVIFEASRIRFISNDDIGRRIGRYLIGMVGVLLIWGGLRELFDPIETLWAALPLRALRYALTMAWVAFYGPLFFVQVGLAKTEPDPGIQMKI